MNETKDQLTREQTQSAVKDKKLQKCYEMIRTSMPRGAPLLPQPRIRIMLNSWHWVF